MFQNLNKSSFLLPLIGANKLLSFIWYRVHKMYLKDTVFGLRIFADLDEFTVVLPKRFVYLMDNMDLDEYNETIRNKTLRLYLKSLGPDGQSTKIAFIAYGEENDRVSFELSEKLRNLQLE